jgi:hypothetical protein
MLQLEENLIQSTWAFAMLHITVDDHLFSIQQN